MIDLVVLKLGETPDDPVAWGAFGDGALVEAGRVDALADLPSVIGRSSPDARIVGVLRGEQVAMRALKTLPRRSAKVNAAAAFLLEDELAEAVGDLHFVVSAGEPRTAFAISKPVIDGWLEAFGEAGVAVKELVPDFAAIGGAPQTLVIVCDDERLIVSNGAAGFAAETPIAAPAVASLIGKSGIGNSGETASIIIYGPDNVSGPLFDTLLDRPADRRALVHETDILAIFAAALTARPAPTNMLQGAYRQRRSGGLKAGVYQRPAMLAAAAVALVAVSGAAAGVRDARVASVYETAAEAMHKAAFPAFDGADIKTHSRSVLSDGVKAASFLDLSARLAGALKDADGVAIDRVRFDGVRGQYMFSIRSNTDAGIEAFRAALDQHGLVATDSGGYRRSGEAWVGEMSARAK